jgi:hypothetical protein
MVRKVSLVVLSVAVLLGGGLLLYSRKIRRDERRRRVEQFRAQAFRAPEELAQVLAGQHPEPVLMHLAFFASLEHTEAALAAELAQAGGQWAPGDADAMARLYRRLADAMPAEEPATAAMAWVELFPEATTFGYKTDAEHRIEAHAGGSMTGPMSAVRLAGSTEEPRVHVATVVGPADQRAVHLAPFRFKCGVESAEETVPPLPPVVVSGTCSGGLATDSDPLQCMASGPGLDMKPRPVTVNFLPFQAEGRVIAPDELGQQDLERMGRFMRGALVAHLTPYVDGVENFHYLRLSDSSLAKLDGLCRQCGRLWEADVLRAEHLSAAGTPGFVPMLDGPLLLWPVDRRGRLEGAEAAYADKQALVIAFTRWVENYESARAAQSR